MPIGTVSAFYIPLDPARWLIEPFPGLMERRQSNDVLRWSEVERVVYERHLTSGLKVLCEHANTIRIDFADYPADLHRRSSIQPDDPDFDEAVDLIVGRQRIINLFALAFTSSYITDQNLQIGAFALSPHELIHISEDGGRSYSSSRAYPVLTLSWQGLPISGNRVAPRSVIDAACGLLDEWLSHQNPRVSDLLVLLNQALVAYRDHNYSLALVSAWTVCEVLLDTRWNDYVLQQRIEHGQTVSNTALRQYQERDFTAAVVTKILSLAGQLPVGLQGQLDQVRGHRNRWLHGLRYPAREAAGLSLEAARDMLLEVADVSVALSLSSQIDGL